MKLFYLFIYLTTTIFCYSQEKKLFTKIKKSDSIIPTSLIKFSNGLGEINENDFWLIKSKIDSIIDKGEIVVKIKGEKAKVAFAYNKPKKQYRIEIPKNYIQKTFLELYESKFKTSYSFNEILDSANHPLSLKETDILKVWATTYLVTVFSLFHEYGHLVFHSFYKEFNPKDEKGEQFKNVLRENEEIYCDLFAGILFKDILAVSQTLKEIIDNEFLFNDFLFQIFNFGDYRESSHHGMNPQRLSAFTIGYFKNDLKYSNNPTVFFHLLFGSVCLLPLSKAELEPFCEFMRIKEN